MNARYKLVETVQMMNEACEKQRKLVIGKLKKAKIRYYSDRQNLLNTMALDLTSVPKEDLRNHHFTTKDSHYAFIVLYNEIKTQRSDYEIKLRKAYDFAYEYARRIDTEFIGRSCNYPKEEMQTLIDEYEKKYKYISVVADMIMSSDGSTHHGGLWYMTNICLDAIKRFGQEKSCYQPGEDHFKHAVENLREMRSELIDKIEDNYGKLYYQEDDTTSQ